MIDVKSFGLKLSDSITAKRICNVFNFSLIVEKYLLELWRFSLLDY